MIRTEIVSANALEILAPEKLRADDFSRIAPLQQLRECLSFGEPSRFIKNHQQKVERIAVIVGHEWQHWLIGAVRLFVHPEVRAYDKSQANKAQQWLLG